MGVTDGVARMGRAIEVVNAIPLGGEVKSQVIETPAGSNGVLVWVDYTDIGTAEVYTIEFHIWQGWMIKAGFPPNAAGAETHWSAGTVMTVDTAAVECISMYDRALAPAGYLYHLEIPPPRQWFIQATVAPNTTPTSITIDLRFIRV